MACSPSLELPNDMEYTGKLYGKIGRRLIPLTMTSEEVDALRDSAIKNAEMAGDLASDLQRLRSAVRRLVMEHCHRNAMEVSISVG